MTALDHHDLGKLIRLTRADGDFAVLAKLRAMQRELATHDLPDLVFRPVGGMLYLAEGWSRVHRADLVFEIGTAGCTERRTTALQGAYLAWGAITHGSVSSTLLGDAPRAPDNSARKAVKETFCSRLRDWGHHALADLIARSVRVEDGRVIYEPVVSERRVLV